MKMICINKILVERNNMDYKYNGNMLENDRIELVASEIIKKYPQIGIEKARDIAMLEERISEDKNIKMQFNRLYNIMLIMQSDKTLVKLVCADLIDILKKAEDKVDLKYYFDVAFQILKYILDERSFPFLGEL